MSDRFTEIEMDEEQSERKAPESNQLNYFEDLEFDINNLDGACEQQQIINMSYHKLYVDELDKFNEEKRMVKVKESLMKEAHAKAYLHYASQKDEKGKSDTLPVLNAKVEIDKDYIKAKNVYFTQLKKQNDAEKRMSILDGVVRSFQQRKNMIEKRIDLYVLGYNGEVRQKKETVKQVQDSIHNKLNKKRKN